MPSIEFDDRPPRSRDELLATVRRDGLRRRYRRNGLVGGLALALVVALAMPVIADGDDGGQRKVAAVDQPTTTAEETTTSVPLLVDETSTTTVETPPPTTVARTTTSLVCRNSTDPRCGPFRWDPDPGLDQPGSVEITYTPAEPKVGETVSFHVRRSDPDGPAGSSSYSIDYGDGTGGASAGGVRLPPTHGCAAGFYGPWTPPARGPHSVEFDAIGRAYESPGSYTVTFASPRDDYLCNEPLNPYNSPVSGSVTLTVSPAPA